MRLNVCCGARILPGYTNVDVVRVSGGPAPDILADARSVPLEAAICTEILCVHGFEHFYRWEVDALAREWLRLLAPGGALVLELPNLIKCCENVLTGVAVDQLSMWGLYGDPRSENPYMTHRWGWTPATLRTFLLQHRFVDIRADEPTHWHAAGRDRRDMRITARKP